MSGQHRAETSGMPRISPLFGGYTGRHHATAGGSYGKETAETPVRSHRATKTAPRPAQRRDDRAKPKPRKSTGGTARAQLAERARTVPANPNQRREYGARVTPLTDRPDRLGNVPRRNRAPWTPPARETLAKRRPVMGQPSASEERTRHQYAAHAPKPAKVTGRARRKPHPLPTVNAGTPKKTAKKKATGSSWYRALTGGDD